MLKNRDHDDIAGAHGVLAFEPILCIMNGLRVMYGLAVGVSLYSATEAAI